MSGATQKSQSWPTAPVSAKKATAVERAGLTEVLVTGIETRWMSVSARPMAMPAKPAGALRAGRAEDDEDEARGQDELDQEAGEEAVAAGRVGAVAVRGEAAGGPVGLAGGDEVEDDRGDEAADHLGDPVGDELAPGEAAADGEAERDRRVEVAAGDRADGVGHGEHGQAEGERDAGEADAELGEAGGEHGAAAAAEHEPEGAECLGSKFLHA